MTSGIYRRTKKGKENMSKGQKGKSCSKETRKKISKALEGHICYSKGKTNIELFGKKEAQKISKKRSDKHKIIQNNPKQKEIRRKIAVERILLNNGVFPSYNMKAVKFFKSYDKKNNTTGQYATHPSEFYIKELGYWPDYINFEKKIIMEYDERYHEKQKEKDLQRQKEIQEFYPDFKFIRIK